MGQIREFGFPSFENAQQLDSGQLSVSSGCKIFENDVSGLLSSKGIFLQLHFFQYIPVPYFGCHKIQSRIFAEFYKTQIGQNSADHRIFGKFSSGM